MKQMKKRALSLVLILAMLGMLLPGSLGGMTVKAASSDFVIENGVLTKYKGSGGDVVIPNSVTSIGVCAFAYDDSLTSVTIPNSVTSIGYAAFEECENLTIVKISNSVKTIEENAFSGCTSLKSITIPNSVKIIEEEAFYRCTSLTNVTIPGSVTTVGKGTFAMCDSLTEIHVDSGNANYSDKNGVLFNKNQTTLISYPGGKKGAYVIPNTVTGFEEDAFGGCEGLTNVTIPNSVTYIEDDSFWGCNSLTSVTIPNSVTYIGMHNFMDCDSLTSITIPNSVTYIGQEVLNDTPNLKDIYFIGTEQQWQELYVDTEDSVTVHYDETAPDVPIEAYDYVIKNGILTSYFGSEKDMTIPNTIIGLGEYAFWENTNVSSVTIPKSVTTIENNPFSHCKNLKKINVSSDNMYFSDVDGVLFNKKQTKLICYPGGKSGTYIIPNSVTSIGEKAFVDCTNLTSVTIPNSVTNIENGAFSDCTGLTNVTIPNSVTDIGERTFWGCTNLTNVTIPDSVKDIEGNAFSYCTSLMNIYVNSGNAYYSDKNGVLFNKNQTKLLFYPYGKEGAYTIPNSVTSIEESAFCDCTSLTSLTIPNSVTSIGESAFYDCTSLTSVTIPNSVTNIGKFAFNECTDLKSVIISNSIATIGSYVFSGCSSLTSVTIPSSVTSIGESAFSECAKLTNITLPNSVKSIGDHAFFSCSSLTSMTIPNSVMSIGHGTFVGCTRLKNVTLPNSITSIEDKVFEYCAALKTIIIPDSVTSIGSSAFNGCTALTSVTIPNSVKDIEGNAFSHCTSLTSVTIPNSVTNIGCAAFYECTGLTNLTIPNSVTKIESSAFENCNKLENVTFIGTKEQWDALSIWDTGLENKTVQFQTPPKILTSISIKSMPTKKTYTVGESFAPAGMILKTTYDDGTTKEITSGFTYTPTGKLTTAGQQKIVVSYGGKSTGFYVTVNAAGKTISSVTIAKKPTKQTYTVGESFNAAGMKLKVTYADNTTAQITSGFTCTPSGKLTTAGQQKIVVTYGGKSTGFYVTVTKAISTVTIAKKPTKQTYTVGESFNSAGMKLKVTYADNTTAEITSGFTCTPSGKLTTVGQQKIVVSYGGKSTGFYVTVTKAISSVTIAKKPNKQTYNVGESFNAAGMKLKVTYNDNTTAEITSGFTCTPSGKLNTAGQQKIVVSYGGKSTGFYVTVE